MMDFYVDDLLGKPYEEHGRGPDAYDCYGLVIEVERRLGKALPDVVYQNHDLELSRKAATLPLARTDRAERGSVIEIESKGELHIGVALSPTVMIHSTYNRGVCVHPIKMFKVRGIYGLTI